MRAALFDLDGTLTDSRPGIVRSIRHALTALGAACPAERDLERYVGPPLQRSLAELLGLRASEADRALALYRERYGTVGLFENRVYPGIRELLARLGADGRRLFVCTSKPTVYARRIVERFSLDRHFEAVYGSELDGRRTDKAELLAHVLASSGLDPAESIMIGDRRYDVAAAGAHGLRAVGVLWGYGSAEELRAAGADRIVATPGELPAAIDRVRA